MDGSRPYVSTILTTRDRPRLFSLALKYYRRQTFTDRELIVVDDGVEHPVDATLLRDDTERLVRLPSGAKLGDKLNAGIAAARGVWCQKMDDDDYYAPNYLATMLSALARGRERVCQPTVAVLAPFLLFDVAGWSIRSSGPRNIPGATLVFGRQDALERGFRGLTNHEDIWFLMDQVEHGAVAELVYAPEIFVAVRHGRVRSERGHTWERQSPHSLVEDDLASLERHPLTPEQFFPSWALPTYRALHVESLEQLR
jgi:glycosyltransferase involved in cell wall biosynthesis